MLVFGALTLVGSASAQSGPEGTPADSVWTQYFCLTPGQCVVGDFNGDGRDDIAVFFHSNSLPIGNPSNYGSAGDVWVALSNGTSFDYPARWKQSFCQSSGSVCKVGDFNGDSFDDIIEFTRGSSGDVSVALSTGHDSFGTSTLWQPFFCVGNEVCDVGDYNGDGNDDIALFTRSLYTDDWGRVSVALSNGVDGFGAFNTWANFFCIQQEMCGSGDFNGDGRDDIIAFRKWDTPNGGAVYVALSTGGWFDKGDSTPWNDYFCPGYEVCGVGDINGDGRDDIITYLRNTYTTNIGWVYVIPSNGSSFPKNLKYLWPDPFCYGTGQGNTGEICGSGNYIDGIGVGHSYYLYSQLSQTGDFNRDGADDLIRFLRSTDSSRYGYVYVDESPPPPPPQHRWLLSILIKLEP